MTATILIALLRWSASCRIRSKESDVKRVRNETLYYSNNTCCIFGLEQVC